MEAIVGAAPWWKTAVVYQIYPRSFCDTSGDGVGDLEGIRGHLDHLQWLGVDAIWISPFFCSPMADCGYDVADYCDVDPLFGSLEDFDRLLAEAHARGLRVMIDWVPNHSSDQHPWFQASRDPASPMRDWYYWRDSASPGRPPNNWRAAFLGAPAWTWDPGTRQWYLHSFLPHQPDLNWGNPEVVEAMHQTLRFWLDRGVDGFRMDVVHLIGKDPDLPDAPDDRSGLQAGPNATTHELLRGLREVLDSYPGDRAMVGEVYILSTAKVVEYYGDNDELHMSFNFTPLYAPWEAGAWQTRIRRVIEVYGPRGAWPTWVLSNHDNPRHRTRYGSEAQARAAAVLLLTLAGTPFLYAGEELGLEDAVITPDRVRDPGGRDGCRAPIPWTPGPDHGWSTDDPWLPWPPDPGHRNVETERADDGSILHLYRKLLAARRASPALLTGEWAELAAPDGVLLFERTTPDDRRVIAVNFTSSAATVGVSSGGSPEDGVLSGGVLSGGVVEVASDGLGEGEVFSGALAPNQAVLVRVAAAKP